MSDRKWHQNPWAWCGCGCCLGIIVIPLLLASLGIGGAFWTLRNLGVQDQALALATENQEVVERLGEPLEAGWLMNGNISVNGDGGSADYSIPVHGPLGDGRLSIEAFRDDGEWVIEELFLRIDGERIDIVGGSALQMHEAVPDSDSGADVSASAEAATSEESNDG